MYGWIELLVWIYFFYAVAYSLCFSLGGLFYKVTEIKAQQKGKFAVFIPAYKEDGVIIESAQQALRQTYPQSHYQIIVIADSLQPETLATLKALPINVVEVHFESSTKVKSLNFALQAVSPDFDYAVILDADNIMQPDFLEKLNDAHSRGWKAVQGERQPKNMDNTMSFLDGLSEAINNHIYRQGSTALGLSASINGSGVSFDFPLFKTLLSGMDSIGGFDRELELLLLEEGVRVVYYKPAKVLDEKVQSVAVFENQRKRWISSQYNYLAKYFRKGCQQLLRGNITYFNSSVLRNIQLPRLINLGLMTSLTIAFYFTQEYSLVSYWTWVVMLGMLVLSMIIAIPGKFYGKEMVRSLTSVPGIFLKMFLLLFRLKGANKKFIHTPHGVSSSPEQSKQ